MKASLEARRTSEGVLQMRRLTRVKAFKWEISVFKTQKQKTPEGPGLVDVKLKLRVGKGSRDHRGPEKQ